MMRMRLYGLGWLLMAAWLAGCDTDDAGEVVIATQECIAFDARMGQMGEETRTVNAMDDDEGLAAEGGFGVFACYTGLHRFSDSNVSSDFMYNTHVAYDNVNSVWTYDPIKYWPNGEGQATDGLGEAKHYVSFFAYAPYSDQDPGNAAGYCIPTFHLQHEQTNPWLTYRLHSDPAEQVDLLYAVPLLDRTKAVPASRMTFTFRHALACVGDRVTIGLTDDLKSNYQAKVTDNASITRVDVQVKSVSVSYHLTERARLVLWTGGEANWQPLSSGGALTTREVVLKEATDLEPYTIYSYNSLSGEGGSNWTDTGHGLFYIPLHREGAVQTAEVSISYEVVTTYMSGVEREERESSATLTLSDYAEAYQAGRHLYLNLSLASE